MTFDDGSPEVEQLVWDEWNREHIAKHLLSPKR
jgi:diamine N-acetyltransferase